MASLDKYEDRPDEDSGTAASKRRDASTSAAIIGGGFVVAAAIISGIFVVIGAMIQGGPAPVARPSVPSAHAEPTEQELSSAPAAVATIATTENGAMFRATGIAPGSARRSGAERAMLSITPGALDPRYASGLMLRLRDKGYRVTQGNLEGVVRLEISAGAPVVFRYTVGGTAITRAFITVSLKAVDSKTGAELFEVTCRAVGAGFGIDDATASAIDDAAKQMAASYQ